MDSRGSALTISGAAQDFPRLLSFYAAPKGTKVRVVYRATVDGPACVIVQDGDKVWAWKDAAGGPPREATTIMQAGAALELLESVQPTEKATPVHRGTWKGWAKLVDGRFAIVLERGVTTQIKVNIMSDVHTSGRWLVHVHRNGSWWAPVRHEQPRERPASLGEAMRLGYALASGLSSEVCAIKELTRREALDTPYAQAQAAKAAAKVGQSAPPLRSKPDDASVGWLARLHVPAEARKPGYDGFPDGSGRMESVVAYLRQHGHTVAAKSLQGWHDAVTNGKTKAPRPLGDIAEAAVDLLRAKYGGKRPKGTQVEDYNNAVAVIGTLLGGIIPARMGVLPVPTTAAAAQSSAHTIGHEAADIGRELAERWTGMSGATQWTDARTDLLRRVSSVLDRAWALVRSPLCAGEARAEALRALRASMDAYARFRDAAMAESGGRRSARVLLEVYAEGGLPPSWLAKVEEGPDKGKPVSVAVPEGFGDMPWRAGARVFAHYDPETMKGSISRLRLDTAAGGPELSYGDSVRTLRYLAETGALAAAKAARACAGARNSAGDGSRTGAHTPASATPAPAFPVAEVSPIYHCDRCGLLTFQQGPHLAIGSVICPSGGAEFKLVERPTMTQVREAAEAGRWMVKEKETPDKPTELPLRLTGEELARLPVGTVVAASMATHQWPAMVIRVGKTTDDSWREWKIHASAPEGPMRRSADLARALNTGGFDAIYVLVHGKGRSDLPWTGRAIATNLPLLPEAVRWRKQDEKHVEQRRTAGAAKGKREALENKRYAEWGPEAWGHIAGMLRQSRGIWKPKTGGKETWTKLGTVPSNGNTPGMSVRLTGADGAWYAKWGIAAEDEAHVLGPFQTEQRAREALITSLASGGTDVPPDVAPAPVAAPAEAPRTRRGKASTANAGDGVTAEREAAIAALNAQAAANARAAEAAHQEAHGRPMPTYTEEQRRADERLVRAEAAEPPKAPKPKNPKKPKGPKAADDADAGADAKIGAAVSSALEALAARLMAGSQAA